MLVSLMRFSYVLEKYYTKIALYNVHDGRIMHRLRCSGIFIPLEWSSGASSFWPVCLSVEKTLTLLKTFDM